MHILKDGEFVLIESSGDFEKTEEGKKAISYVKRHMNLARLWNENCVIDLDGEKVMVHVKGYADLIKQEDYKAEVCSKSDKYELGQVVNFKLKDVLDVFPPIEDEEDK